MVYLTNRLVFVSLMILWIGLNEIKGFRFGNRRFLPLSKGSLRSKWLQKSKFGLFSNEIDAPVINELDNENGFAKMTVFVDGVSTEKAFTEAADTFLKKLEQSGNEKLQAMAKRNNKMTLLYQIFGEKNIKLHCSSVLYDQIQQESKKSGLNIAGNVLIEDFHTDQFQPGQPHKIDIRADLFPNITYSGSKAYKGLKVSVHQPTPESDTATMDPQTASVFKSISMQKKFEEVKKNIQYEHKIMMPTVSTHQAGLGDMVIASVSEYTYDSKEQMKGGLISNTKRAELHLLPDRCNAEVVKQLLNITVPCRKAFPVTFPPAYGDPTVAGKTIYLEIDVAAIYRVMMPEWNDELAKRISPALTIEGLNATVMERIEEQMKQKGTMERLEAINLALLAVANFSWVPNSTIEELTQRLFQQSYSKLQQEGYDRKEILEEMMDPEKYQNFASIMRDQMVNEAKLHLIYEDIIAKEEIFLTVEEEYQVENKVNTVIREYMKEFQQSQPTPSLCAEGSDKTPSQPIVDRKKIRQEIERAVLHEKVVRLILSTADVEYVSSSGASSDVSEVVKQDDNSSGSSSSSSNSTSQDSNGILDAEIIPPSTAS